MAIGLPHWAQGFSRGKEPTSVLAMAHLPFSFMFDMFDWTASLSDKDVPRHHLLAEH
jgi:hypothetical protein